MKELERLLVEDILVMGSIPISASPVDPEAVKNMTELGICEVALDQAELKARKAENRFVEARLIKKMYHVVKTQYGYAAEFDARVQIMMAPYVVVPETL